MEVTVSFDLFFQPCRYRGKPIEVKNPFTGKVQTKLPNGQLSASELSAVERVLKKAKAKGPDEHGCYVVELGDGGAAEVFGHDLSTGCMVAVRGMTPHLSRFLFNLLQAGNWVMLPAMEEAVAITTSPTSVKGVPADFPRVVVCDSAEELAVLLADGIRAWEQYRDQVVGGAE
jgi:hypothetical protein